MKTRNLLFMLMAVLTLGVCSCEKSKSELTWRINTIPEATEEANQIAEKVNNVLASYYQDLGVYTPAHTDGHTSYTSRVIISGKDYNQVKKMVEDATALADRVLSEEMDYGSLTGCHVIVTLFQNNNPSEILVKDYIRLPD